MLARLRALFQSRKLDCDFEGELAAHLEMMVEDYIRRGLTPAEARREARVRLGGLTQLREAHREVRGPAMLEILLRDLQYALRTLRKSPGFTLLAVLTLAIGIGVNTAVFTAYNALALRPVQATDPDQLGQVIYSNRSQFFSYPEYLYYRDHSRSLTGLLAGGLGNTVTVGGSGLPVAPAATEGGSLAGLVGFHLPQTLSGSSEVAGAGGVSDNYFQVLGVAMVRGRAFLPGEDAAVMSYNYWEQRFGCAPDIVGRTLFLNGTPVTIVGISPKDFTGTMPVVPNLWVPLPLQARVLDGSAGAAGHLTGSKNILEDRNANCCRLYGRLRDSVSRGQAEAELDGLAARLREIFRQPGVDPGPPPRFTFSKLNPNGPPDPGFTSLAVLVLGAVSLVLLIACANVASLLLARSAARQREIAIRLAIGASRGRLVRQLLTENALMSIAAGALGVVFSWWCLRFLVLQVGAVLPGIYTIVLHVAPDYRVLAYTLLLSIAGTVACGLAPALEASRPNLTSALRDEGAAFAGRLRKSRLRDLMVGTQVAVSLVLLIGAGLLVRTSQRALAVDLGFDYGKIVMLELLQQRIPPGQLAARHIQLTRDFEGLPEVVSVAVSSRLPLAGGVRSTTVSLNGRGLAERGSPIAVYTLVTPSYFDTLGIPMVQGRNFSDQESRDNLNFDGSPVIVSQATARRFWPNQDPIGQRLAFGPGPGARSFAGEKQPESGSSVVIGVAKDVRSLDLTRIDNTCLYLPISRAFAAGNIIIRTRGDEGRAMTAITRLFQSAHSDMQAMVADSRAAFSNQPAFVAARMGAIGSAIIGILGLLMAAVGMHGTVGFAVSQRTHEIGIRMALGARRGSVLRMILMQTMRPVIIGVLVGFWLTAAAARLMSSFLLGLSALDATSFLGATALLAAVALLAGYLPAKRATRVDPVIALRYE